MDQSGPIWTQLGPVLTLLEQFWYNPGPDWTSMDQSGQTGPFWTSLTSLDQFGSVWISLDQPGPEWTSLDQSGTVWTSLNVNPEA